MIANDAIISWKSHLLLLADDLFHASTSLSDDTNAIRSECQYRLHLQVWDASLL